MAPPLVATASLNPWALSGLRKNSFKKKHETEFENYTLISEFEMGQEEAEAVIMGMKGMEVQEVCEYLEMKYHCYNALYAYEDTELHRGTTEEINSYIKDKLKSHSFFTIFPENLRIF